MRTLQTVALVFGLVVTAAASAETDCKKAAASADRIVMARDMGMEEAEVVRRAEKELKTDDEKQYFRDMIAAIFQDQGMYENDARKMMMETCQQRFGT